MKSVIAHPVYGEIVYEESFWTGKKSIKIDGNQLIKLGKKVFFIFDFSTISCLTNTFHINSPYSSKYSTINNCIIINFLCQLFI